MAAGGAFRFLAPAAGRALQRAGGMANTAAKTAGPRHSGGDGGVGGVGEEAGGERGAEEQQVYLNPAELLFGGNR